MSTSEIYHSCVSLVFGSLESEIRTFKPFPLPMYTSASFIGSRPHGSQSEALAIDICVADLPVMNLYLIV